MKQAILTTFFLFTITISTALISIGCGNSNKMDGEHEELPSVALTLWTEKMEMFTEYEVPVQGHKIRFIIHLTKLDDFTPVRSGKVILTFTGDKNSPVIKKGQPELLREGIFTPVITFNRAGKYKGNIRYEGEGITDTFDIGTIIVYSDHDEVPHNDEVEGENISFLKEQQWKTEFRTEEIREMGIIPSIEIIGEVIPRQQDHIEVTAPVAGVLDPDVNRYMAAPGSFVKKGDVIALLAPQAGAGESWQQIKLALEQAENRYKRGERLKKSGAISRREFEDLQREYLLLKAGFPENSRGKSRYYSVTSPISGNIEKLKALPGHYLNKGDTILHVTNSTKVWLKLNIYETDLNKLNNPSGADISTTGSEEVLQIEAENLKLLSRSGIFDKNTGSVPYFFEVTNPDMKLKIGQMVKTRLYTGREKKALCTPVSSIYNDEGRKVVFIQTEGESFEKRTVKTGATFRGYIEILDGVVEGEHVVSKGAYFVKLAGTSTPIGHGHTH